MELFVILPNVTYFLDKTVQSYLGNASSVYNRLTVLVILEERKKINPINILSQQE